MTKLTLALIVCGAAWAQTPSLCVDDRAGLNRFAREEFDKELERFLADAGTGIQIGNCSGPAIALTLNAHPPERYSRALGLAYRSGNRVLPDLRVYLHPVLKILGPGASSTALGRALARVAAHELTHYLRQQVDHDCSGLMSEVFTTRELH